MNNERFEQLKNDFLPRFWDTENNVMVYPEFVEYTIKSDLHKQCNVIYFISKGRLSEQRCDITDLLFNPKFIPMRPTGLKDKNGTLIYEGDIVKDNLGGEYIIEWGISDYTLHGGFRNSGFIFFRIKKPDDLGICSGELEIIGNIHEKESK